MCKYSLNAQDSDSVRELHLRPGEPFSQETSELRLKSLQILRKLITSDDLVGVKMFKIKLLSNLVSHTLRENVSASDKTVAEGTYSEVIAIVRAFKENRYRE